MLRSTKTTHADLIRAKMVEIGAPELVLEALE